MTGDKGNEGGGSGSRSILQYNFLGVFFCQIELSLASGACLADLFFSIHPKTFTKLGISTNNWAKEICLSPK